MFSFVLRSRSMANRSLYFPKVRMFSSPAPHVPPKVRNGTHKVKPTPHAAPEQKIPVDITLKSLNKRVADDQKRRWQRPWRGVQSHLRYSFWTTSPKVDPMYTNNSLFAYLGVLLMESMVSSFSEKKKGAVNVESDLVCHLFRLRNKSKDHVWMAISVIMTIGSMSPSENMEGLEKYKFLTRDTTDEQLEELFGKMLRRNLHKLTEQWTVEDLMKNKDILLKQLVEKLRPITSKLGIVIHNITLPDIKILGRKGAVDKGMEKEEQKKKHGPHSSTPDIPNIKFPLHVPSFKSGQMTASKSFFDRR